MTDPPVRKTAHRPTVIVYKSRLLPYSETFIREQVRMLSGWRGILAGDGMVRKGLALDGLDVRMLGYRHRFARHLASLGSPYLIWSWARLRALKAERADLLHIHFATDAYRIWPLARQLDLPTLITLHGYDITTYRSWWEAGNGGRHMRKFPAGLLRLAQDRRVHFIAVSKAIRESAIEFGLPEDKITVRPIGVDTRRFTPGPIPIAARRDVLYVGRLVEKKGCRYLLQAFEQIQDDFPESSLVIVGDGPLGPELKAYAKERGVRAIFRGALPVEQVRECLDRSRMFCLPSITAENGDAEGMGIVLLEAQAAGVPVITSARGGAQEGIVHGRTGFAHAEKDVAALREGLRALLVSDELAASFGAAGRRHMVENMDIRDCMARLEAFYDHHAFSHLPMAAQALRSAREGH
ncbi:glycosyltransferase [Frateuria soli]|uniref:glycosyltransferase n=1 Tax=Frateuria soli TaxID=1542730 RepID=UPI001E4D3DE2|nr:glycosyltransferase [Frateuria soli]UGB38530.1 glycosyltransferase [Frateuria soli]